MKSHTSWLAICVLVLVLGVFVDGSFHLKNRHLEDLPVETRDARGAKLEVLLRIKLNGQT